MIFLIRVDSVYLFQDGLLLERSFAPKSMRVAFSLLTTGMVLIIS